MATIFREVEIGASAQFVWEALRDFGGVGRIFPGIVTEVTMEPGMRHVRFASGLVVHELLVTLDDQSRRVAYASVQGKATHHNASMQVIPLADRRCKFVWITDVLPDAIAVPISAIIDHALPIMVRTLEAESRKAV